jgi:predicted lactoylglutathione lyase
MIEHFSLPVRDFETSRDFYIKALKPLGYKMNMDFEDAAGFMEGGHTSFWIARNPDAVNTHVAFLAKSKEQVKKFYETAIEAGGISNGEPGFRKVYSPGYYAGFVFDPVGNNIEAVYYEKE